MTTSNLVGLETQSFQATHSSPLDMSALIGATQRLSAYTRLKSWLTMPETDAVAAASAFRQAVATLPEAEQALVVEAERDALSHGFTFPQFQKLREYALPAVAEALAFTELDPER